MIVRESINFERGQDPKTVMKLGKYVPGRLFKYPEAFSYRPKYPSVFMYIKSGKNIHYFYYIGRFINPENSLFGNYFTLTGNPASENNEKIVAKDAEEKMIPLSQEENERLKKFFSDEENQSVLQKIEEKTETKILTEATHFQRGMSDREIKDTLVGWRKGQLLINPYTNIVYVFLEEWEGENNIEIFSLGHLRNIGSAKKVFFQKYKKQIEADWARTNFKPKKNLRPLTSEEWQVVKPSIDPEYINKVQTNFGVKILL